MTVVTAEVRKIKLQGQKSADEDTPLKPLISGMVVEEGAQQPKRRIQRNPNDSHLGLVSPPPLTRRRMGLKDRGGRPSAE